MRLRFANVSLRDGRQVVVAPLTFTLEAGQIGCLFGPARTGKTAALLMAGGYMKGWEGQIWLGDCPVHEKPFQARRLTGLGTIPGLNPLPSRLTLRENLHLEARLQRVPPFQRAKQVEQVLSEFGLTAVAQMHPSELNGPQAFLASLAMAAIHDPAVYLIDDPLAGLTLGELAQVWPAIERLAHASKTVLIASQNEWVADRSHLVITVGGEVTGDERRLAGLA
jgi:ABC-type multidrug transport system ATPase subunit